MKSFAFPSAALLTVATAAYAQNITVSPPFQLVVLSDCPTYNGSVLIACHEGAAIEGLCTSNATSASAYNTYNFNYTVYDGQVIDPNIGPTGTITWLLHGSNFNASSAMSLNYNDASNVAIPLFFPGETPATYVAFDQNNTLVIPSYFDDTKVPQNDDGTAIALHRWYLCQNYYLGYNYLKSLSWVLGIYGPQNPSCEKVEVVRVFV